ncbi:hypothetical protein [Streptomyces sp. NWU339]|uniref:hypothetical protein n=1 Tax=Streptomyces sp. NWU339 TaxID=2185284 RepID=UPI0011B6B9D9|nr:hypothetical protein [Streptomyces sp. NWU339]
MSSIPVLSGGEPHLDVGGVRVDAEDVEGSFGNGADDGQKRIVGADGVADLVEPRLVAKYLPGDGDGGGDAVDSDALDAALGAGEIYYLQPCSGCHNHVGIGGVKLATSRNRESRIPWPVRARGHREWPWGA